MPAAYSQGRVVAGGAELLSIQGTNPLTGTPDTNNRLSLVRDAYPGYSDGWVGVYAGNLLNTAPGLALNQYDGNFPKSLPWFGQGFLVGWNLQKLMVATSDAKPTNVSPWSSMPVGSHVLNNSPTMTPGDNNYAGWIRFSDGTWHGYGKID